MAPVVLKFGGTSVGSVERIRHVAALIRRECDAGHKVAVVVSAMSGETNRLVGLVDEILPPDSPDSFREHDAVVAAGEQISAGLTALALQAEGLKARSWQGWQLPLKTDDAHGRARIEHIAAETIKKDLDAGVVAIVTGFQGVTDGGSISTLGRGGSDTSAVALAAALGAERCDIYTDVDGIYTTDPRVAPKARRLNKIAYEEMLEMASQGAKVLQIRSVEMAMKHGVRVRVLSSFSEGPGSLLTDEEEVMERRLVTGVAYSMNEAQITLVGVPDAPGVAAGVFLPLAEKNINVDMIVQDVDPEATTTNMTFTVGKTDLRRAVDALKAKKDEIAYRRLVTRDNVAKISVIGVGMRSHAGLAETMFATLAAKKINIHVITTSEIKVSVLIDDEYTELAVRALHTAYGLDKEGPDAEA
ncbi:MAG: aspartate kinase [Rickettsiales bacterium]